MTGAKKKKKGRGVQAGLRLVEERRDFWDEWSKNPGSMIDRLKEFGLSGADLLVLDPGIEYPAGDELEPRLRKAMTTGLRLLGKLKETVEASSFDPASKKAIIETIKAYGKAMEESGSLYVQFELRSVDQWAAARTANLRAEPRKLNSTRQKRLTLISQWIERNLPSVGSYEELYRRRPEITDWIKSNGGYFPHDPKNLREDLKEAFARWIKIASSNGKTAGGGS